MFIVHLYQFWQDLLREDQSLELQDLELPFPDPAKQKSKYMSFKSNLKYDGCVMAMNSATNQN